MPSYVDIMRATLESAELVNRNSGRTTRMLRGLQPGKTMVIVHDTKLKSFIENIVHELVDKEQISKGAGVEIRQADSLVKVHNIIDSVGDMFVDVLVDHHAVFLIYMHELDLMMRLEQEIENHVTQKFRIGKQMLDPMIGFDGNLNRTYRR